jgi:hypothetical protein
MSPLPRNAQSLIELRKRGTVPALPVLVSLVGPQPFSNVTLQAKAGDRYDWRSIAALDIEVFASTAVPFPALLQTLADLAAAVPRHMVLTFAEGARVECGEMRTLQDFALFDWFPIAIRHAAWAESTKLAKRLWAELGDRLPIPYDEAASLIGQAAQETEACA